jgi:hypothetical protein
MTSMRVLPIAALMTATVTLGLTLSAAAQMLRDATPQPQQTSPCFKDFAPIRAETEKRANAIKAAMQKKLPRGEICGLFKQFTAAEAKLVRFILNNAQSCGIPPEAGRTVEANHARSLRSQKQVCEGVQDHPPRLRMAAPRRTIAGGGNHSAA